MTDSTSPDEISIHSEQSLEELAWAIEASQGQFLLMLARCNYARLRSQLINRLQEICAVEIRVLTLQKSTHTLYTRIREEVADAPPQALMIVGLETVDEVNQMLPAVNSVREEFRKNFCFPIVLWITDEIQKKLVRLAPDLESWASSVEFTLAPDTLIQNLQQVGERLFSTLLSPSPLSFNQLLTKLDLGFLQRSEVEIALQDLQRQGVSLNAELQATLNFARGLNTTDLTSALEHFQQSLNYWQQQTDLESPPNEPFTPHIPHPTPLHPTPHTPHPSPSLKTALTLFYIGRTLYYICNRDKDRQPDWDAARKPLQQCLEKFEQANRPDLVAKSITQLERVLDRMQSWDDLETLAQKSLPLQQTYGNLSKLAQDYRYLAMVALKQQKLTEANRLAHQALDTLAQVPEDQGWQGLYLLTLAQTERAVGKQAEAIAHLTQAHALGDRGQPRLYISILKSLQDFYLEQKNYLEAFKLKQEQRSIEQQYQLRAFVGAGRLRPQRQELTVPNSTTLPSETVSPEIAAAGRQQDLNRLVERIGRNDYRLIVLHGNSGVGKSSLVNAGLVPALRQKAIGFQTNLPVVMRVYTNWAEELEHLLTQALEARRTRSQEPGARSQEPEFGVRGQGSEFGTLTSKPEILTSELETPTSKLETSTSKHGTLTSKLDASTSEPETSTSELETLTSEPETPTSKLDASTSEPETPTSKLDASTSEPGTSTSGLKTQNSKLKTQISTPHTPSPTPHTPPSTQNLKLKTQNLLTSLRQNEQTNLRTVLIFDQFEEFFFVYPKPEDRKPFFEFLTDCLQVLSVKVLLVLREDYLHFLLECSRLPAMATTGIDILSNNVRYGLGNFTVNDTRAIIRSLTDRARFHLEPALVDQLVQDLASDLGEVRPIELQVVGAQLQADNITTLTQYQALGGNPKEALVERYLAEVVADCGAENHKIAELLLFLLTDEKGTRPLKTRAELEKELHALAALDEKTNALDLVLTIFVKSGLVLLLPEVPADRYQLVHDYLAAFIRHQQEPKLNQLIADLEAERQQRKRSEERLGQVQKRQIPLAVTAVSFIVLATLAAVFAFQAESQRKRAEVSQIDALNAYSEALLASNKPFDALMESLRAGKRLQSVTWAGEELRSRITTALQKAVYGVREQIRLEGHTDRVNDVDFSPDGRTIASVSNDQTLKLWSLDGKLLKTIDVQSEWINGVSFSPNGQIIATVDQAGAVKLWSLDGKLIKTFQGRNNWLVGISFSPNGKMLVSSGNGNRPVELWSLNGKLLKTLTIDTDTQVNDVRFSPDNMIIAAATDNGMVQLWNLNGQLLSTFQADRLWLASVSFSPDGQTIASGGGDEKTIKLWSRNGTLLKTLEGHSGSVMDIRFSPDGQTIASASNDKTIKLWSRDDTLLNTLEGHKEGVRGVAFSPDGRTIASSSTDKTVRLWNLTGQADVKVLREHTNTVNGVAFSADSKMMATASNDGTARFWNLNGKLLKTLKRSSSVNQIEFSPDGKQVATANAGGNLGLWDVSSGRQLAKWRGTTRTGWKYIGLGVASQPDQATGFRVQQVYENSPAQKAGLRAGDRILMVDGQSLVGKSDTEFSSLVRGVTAGTRVNLRISRQGRSDFDLPIVCGEVNPPADMYDVSFSPDGKMFASASEDKTAKLWSLKGKLLKSLEGHSKAVNEVAFSPDGKTIATASKDKTVKLWSLNGTLLQTLRGHSDEVKRVTFSPDGKTIATTSNDKTIKLWSLDGKLLKTFEGHTDGVLSVAFSSDGKTIASGSDDKTVKLWNLDGKLLNTLYGQSDSVVSVHFSPDSKIITSVSSQRALVHWNLGQLSLNELMPRGCNWVRDYLKNAPNLNESDRHLCDNINSQK
ncbi:PDZ domain-containing protein [Kovacikia minuta CCNUW1]|uniref:WD40 domain-containing protein n=1 Tax=Kovacikia minuta TaxID=2931930 RepID=UPI001CCD235A|nr:PDZ domain-containing protein [Kovacikia minuta]UBF24489.1 PDZ domain-containing protein [Kovacikia minuta CCNUW1]